MTSLAFITPVFERYSLTRIGFQQRRWVCDELKSRYGIDATVIVIGDDDNLNVAEEFGFLTVNHPNMVKTMGKEHKALGQKFNAGYQKAHREGIDLVFPIGSDSWIDPVYFDTLPEPGELLVSRAYNLIPANTDRRGALWIDWEGGVQWVSHTEDWAHRDYKPVSPSLAKGCDTSTWLHRKPGVTIRENFHHQLEYVAFQSPTAQITSYALVMEKYGRGEVFGDAVFGDLEAHYRLKDIYAVRAHYANEIFASEAATLAEMEEQIAVQREVVGRLGADYRALLDGELAA